MRLRNRGLKRLEHPKAGMTAGAIWWIGVPFFILWCAIQLIGALGESLTLPRSQVFAGELRSEQEVLPVVLHQGLVLKQVVVAEGDQVNAGQTLAVLDKEQIMFRQREITAELTALDVFQACLRSSGEEMVLGHEAPQSELELAVQDALRECRLFRETHRLTAEQISSEIALLEGQRNLLQHKVRLSPEVRNSQDFDRLEELVSAAMATTKLDEKILKQRTKLQEVSLKTEQDTLSKLRQAKVSANLLEEENRMLSEALAAPRIVAQEAGRVGRIRGLPDGFRAQQDVEIAVLRPGEKGGYVMTFTFPTALQGQLGLGAKVKATLLGWSGPGMGPELRGQVTDFLPPTEKVSSNHLVAEVTLSDGSVRAIETAGYRLALNGPGMASLLSVSLEEETLEESVKRTLARDFETGDGVLHRIVEEFRARSILVEGS